MRCGLPKLGPPPQPPPPTPWPLAAALGVGLFLIQARSADKPYGSSPIDTLNDSPPLVNSEYFVSVSPSSPDPLSSALVCFSLSHHQQANA